ncbi:sensor histidine kinase [Amycolatopsis granulosa]|uniref:sensor histidine kinase n=1 Tax=Amycolatopsis granulosa TaxID=185684 RepID=UPI00142449DF|nr:HAMP domain-containing sensor histidine kinase [Amycolatopsis granulosa]NIH84764.1 two-component system OmpR family sensor kinase [Amycolatopsis granulosa]
MTPRHPAHRRGPRRARPLRTRLIAALVALPAVVCLVVGVISEFALSRFLTQQVDAQVRDAVERTRHLDDPRDGDPLRLPGTATGTLYARLSGGQVREAATLGQVPGSPENEARALPAADAAVLPTVPVDGHPHTISLSGGDYRVSATVDGGTVLIVGLPMHQAEETLVTVGVSLGAVAAVAVLGAGLLGAVVVRRTLRPLDRVAAAAAQVTELPLDRRDVALPVRVPLTGTDPATEVGQVGHALNQMLVHIDHALDARANSERRVRQFVADASHELRTPLAAIRGYAELTRRSNGRVPPEIAHAMRQVESAADRMTALVDDLLLLARLDAGRPLETAEVDLTRLAADAVGDAQIAGPRHRWRLDLPPDPVVVTGDAQRLRQVLANLLAGGRTHTPPGTTVTTRLVALAGDAVAVLTVTDDGPGIPADLLPHVFERFARGEASRSNPGGSTGLGMAIVAAVVHAHHGTVEVRSRPGRTEFEVRLPRTGSAQHHHNDGQARPVKVSS